MNSSKDKTKSQCLGDNRVIDEGPLAADGERVEASGRGGGGGRGVGGDRPRFSAQQETGVEAPGTTLQAISMQGPRAPSLKGCPADLARFHRGFSSSARGRGSRGDSVPCAPHANARLRRGWLCGLRLSPRSSEPHNSNPALSASPFPLSVAPRPQVA